jgi:hypothetical protein
MSSISDQPLFINQLPSSIEIPREYEQFREIVSLLLMRIVDAVNKKEGSLYYLQELGNFQSFYTWDYVNGVGLPFQFRNGYRNVFDVVALNGANIPGGAMVNFAHNIVGLKYATLIYASCTSVANDFFTVVYPNATMDAVNINFTNPLGGTDLNSVIFVAEYLKT